MPVNGPGGLEIASMRRRALAALIDAAVFLPPVALVGGGGVWLYIAYLRRRSGEEEAEFDFAEHAPFRRIAEPRWRAGLWAATAPLDIALRNWRSPGARAMGLRRVDARTGDPVSVRGAAIHNVVQTASGELNRWVQRPFSKRFAERQRALRAELREISRTHGDDHEAQHRANDGGLSQTQAEAVGFLRAGIAGRRPEVSPGILVSAQSDPVSTSRRHRGRHRARPVSRPCARRRSAQDAHRVVRRRRRRYQMNHDHRGERDRAQPHQPAEHPVHRGPIDQ